MTLINCSILFYFVPAKINIMQRQKNDLSPINLLHPYQRKYKWECGIDEAGRGCGAGPVVAAAVILPKSYFHPLLNDSKLVKAEHRALLRDHIVEHAIYHSIGIASVEEIDQYNILQSTFLAMNRAIESNKNRVCIYLIDGNRFRNDHQINYRTVIGGDGRIAAIAAASILAKTYRDALMEELHIAHPAYHWHQNKGYLTRHHLATCREVGLCEHHRKSFNFMKEELVPVAAGSPL